MKLSKLKSYLLRKPFTTEDYPFGPETMVVKVLGKMFSLIPWEQNPLSINLKCDPNDAQILRSMFEAVNPGYHMNKEHWNTVTLDGSISEEIILKMIDDSYDLVVRGMNKRNRLKVEIEKGKL